LYYELKLALLCWLMLAGGADTVYRKLRRLLIVRFGNRIVTTEDDQDKDQLDLLRSEIPEIVEASQAAPGETTALKTDTAAVDWEEHDWEELKRTEDAFLRVPSQGLHVLALCARCEHARGVAAERV